MFDLSGNIVVTFYKKNLGFFPALV